MAECVYCWQPADATDHIVSRVRGGGGDPDRLAPCCRSCDASKGAGTPDEWLADGLLGSMDRSATTPPPPDPLVVEGERLLAGYATTGDEKPSVLMRRLMDDLRQ